MPRDEHGTQGAQTKSWGFWESDERVHSKTLTAKAHFYVTSAKRGWIGATRFFRLTPWGDTRTRGYGAIFSLEVDGLGAQTLYIGRSRDE